MKVMIVDDSDTVRGQLRVAFEKEKWTVVEAFDGLDGFNKAKKHTDLGMIISDINMPELDGLQMCEWIRNQTGHTMIPIIMLTTETNPDLKAQGKKMGVKGWIVKPLDAAKMVEMAKKIIES